MKKVNFLIVFTSIFLLSASYEQPQDPQGRYYYAFEEKIFLTEVSNKIIVSFDEKHISETRQNLQRNAQVQQIDDTQIHNNVYSR